MERGGGVHTYVAAVENATEFFSADLQIEPIESEHYDEIKSTNLKDFMGQMSDLLAVSYSHLTLPTTPYV